MQYKVVRHAPRKTVKQGLLVVAAMLAFLLIGFVSGQWCGKEAVFQNSALSQQLFAANNKNDELQKDLVAAELSANVQEQVAQGLQVQLTELLSANAELKDAVSFYRDLMDVDGKGEGLRIADFALFATKTPLVYQFSVLVTQTAENRKYVGGEVIVKFIGSQDDNRQSVVFGKDNALVGFPLKYRFRYFQDLVGQLRLPQGFSPERVSIEVRQQGNTPVTADFEWAIEQA